jgi:hypothetical protein
MNETALVNNSQFPPKYDNFPPTLDGVKEPSTWGRAWYYRIRTIYRLHLLPIKGQMDVRCIYPRGRLEIYSLEDVPETLGLINFRYLETQTLLQRIQVRHIITWIPHATTERTIIAKLVRSVLPELFGKNLPEPVYRVLSEDEYIERETYHNCTCSCNN